MLWKEPLTHRIFRAQTPAFSGHAFTESNLYHSKRKIVFIEENDPGKCKGNISLEASAGTFPDLRLWNYDITAWGAVLPYALTVIPPRPPKQHFSKLQDSSLEPLQPDILLSILLQLIRRQCCSEEAYSVFLPRPCAPDYDFMTPPS